MISPCYGCQRRHGHCHAECPDYTEYWAKCEQLRAARAADAKTREMREGLRKQLVKQKNQARQGRLNRRK